MKGETAPFEKVGEYLYQYRPSGVYYARIKAGGKEIRRSLTTKDKHIAKSHLAELRKELGHHRRVTHSACWRAYDEAFPRRTPRSTGKGAGQTCHVERWNNTLRQRPGRFVRLFIHQHDQPPVI